MRDPRSEPVPHPVMIHRWQWLTFLHWPFPVKQVARLLPRGLEVDTFDGRSWISLVPFRMQLWSPGLSAVRRTFPETNVRTYVRGPDGASGIWFFSLDASDLGAVSAARTLYRLPYAWSRMRITTRGREITYEAERRWPAPSGIRSTVRVDVDQRPRTPAALTEMEDFLVSRWRLYGTGRGGLWTVPAEHPPWRLQSARLTHCDDGLVGAVGLPPPETEPLAHYSPGVQVRIGRRRRLVVAG